jgi:glycerol-3-phosphate dehydrogenase subunit B
MSGDDRSESCDVMIIGAGMAGMAAALFAARRGLAVVQAGLAAEINFASGMLDLLGVHPVAAGRLWTDPWAGIARLRADEPRHPYALLSPAAIHESMTAFLGFLDQAGYPYFTRGTANLEMITPAGTVKTTYAVPHTMRHGALALADGRPGLLVDFTGLKGYSARQIAMGLAPRWPDLRTVRLDVGGDGGGELHPERLARSLELAAPRRELARAIRPHVGRAAVVGLPAVLSVSRTLQALADLQDALNLPVFEVPTMLPTVAGLRLRESFEQHLPAMGVRVHYRQRVIGVRHSPGGGWLFEIGDQAVEQRIRSRAAVLCSGRFFGRGLHAERTGIRETVFGLPVTQPARRSDWHHRDLLHGPGHPINRAGVAVDDRFRPVDDRGRPVYPDLFAAGSILAHQDWMRQKCGSGLAIATAWGAVEACRALSH